MAHAACTPKLPSGRERDRLTFQALLDSYLAVFIAAIIGFGLVATALIAARVLAPFSKEKGKSISYECGMLPIGSTAQPVQITVRGPAGARLLLRAGLIGERAYDFHSSVRVEALAAGATLAAVEVPGSVDPQPAWLAADGAVPTGEVERDFSLRISTAGDPRPPLCVALWTTR